jgi:hypothetical protein
MRGWEHQSVRFAREPRAAPGILERELGLSTEPYGFTTWSGKRDSNPRFAAKKMVC